jgi:serine/threonine protein kinase
MFEMTRFIYKYHVCWIAVFVELSPDEMGKLIGSGAFGKVRLIVDKKSTRQFAMKIITKPVGEAARARALDWKAEVELNTLVDSEYVVKVVECYDTEEDAMIVMELCESGNLEDYVHALKKQNKKLSEYVSSTVLPFCFFFYLIVGAVETCTGSRKGIG